MKKNNPHIVKFKNIFSNLKDKIKNLSKSQIASLILWLLTFILLMIMIIVASYRTNLAGIYDNLIASITLIFSLSLISSIIFIVFVKKREKNKKHH